MTKSAIYLVIIIIVSTAVLYMLPRYVVENSENDVAENARPEGEPNMGAGGSPVDGNHSFQIPDSVAADIAGLYETFKNAEIQEKRFIFADSLAKAYKLVGKLDSSAKYTEVKALEDPNIENFIIAGDGYYEAFNFAVDRERSSFLAGKVQDYYLRVLEEDPKLLDIKAKLAMTYVVGSNPMQGIKMLQDIMVQDPENELAIYNLGMLSITSGQYEKALERFEILKRLDPENPEAYFYLGYCNFELGKKEESKPYFQKVLELGISGDLVIASEEYLKRIN